MWYYGISQDKDNQTVKWGAIKYEDLFGENGWCNADDGGRFQCPCRIDGVTGGLCNIKSESFCQNQCS